MLIGIKKAQKKGAKYFRFLLFFSFDFNFFSLNQKSSLKIEEDEFLFCDIVNFNTG